jgi:outer membrane protein assembly factor BamE
MVNHIATPKLMSAKPRYSIRSALEITALATVALTVLAGCSSVSNMTSGMSTSAINPINWITPYKVDIIQGNFISKEQVDALKAGMTRAQVKDVLGTPLLADIFHNDRWDYVFTLKRRNVEPQSYKYTVFFKGDLLERFEGDTMPSEAEFIARIDSGRKLGKVPVLEATEEQLNKESTRVPASSGSAASAVFTPAPLGTASPKVYPPLETPAR